MLWDLVKRLRSAAPRPERGAYEQASRLYAQREYAAARDLCRDIVAVNPAAAEVWNLYALCWLGLDNGTAALDVLQSALESIPDDADLNMSMAVVCPRLKFEPRGIEHCPKALAAR